MGIDSFDKNDLKPQPTEITNNFDTPLQVDEIIPVFSQIYVNPLSVGRVNCDPEITSNTIYTIHAKGENSPPAVGGYNCSLPPDGFQADNYNLSDVDCEDIDPWDHTERFLKRFDGVKTFQTFSDKGKNGSLAHVLPHLGDTMDELDALNRRGAGIFLTINETDGVGRKTENITRVRAVFVDLDGAPVEPVYAYKPHIVVESSPGKYHAYWLCHDVPLEAFSQIQETLSQQFNSDPKVKDLPRVMRLPGFLHQKEEPFMSRIITENFHDPLSFAEIVALFPPKPRKQWSARKPITTHYKNDSERKYVGPYGACAGDRNHSTMKIIMAMIHNGRSWDYIEEEAFKHGYACCPPLDEREISSVLRSCRRYL